MPNRSFDGEKFASCLDLSHITFVYGAPAGALPQLSQSQLDLFARHAALVVEANRAFNLTRITDPAEMAVKHYLDSLAFALALDFSTLKSAVDIGSGAGFPGIPLAVAFPKVAFTLLEATHKKAHFLEIVIKELGLSNCRVVAARAETTGRGPLRESFDAALSRAVAPLSVLAEFSAPLLKIGGAMAAAKGPNCAAELVKIRQIGHKIGLLDYKTTRFRLDDAGERIIVIGRKEAATPARFPRRPGIPGKRPLK